MSLGFIVAVVFAIVLLTLSITWLQQLIGNIGGLTDDLTQQAQAKIQETFQAQKTNFAVWPTQYAISSGNTLKMSAGILNNDPAGSNRIFALNVVPVASSICQTGQFESCTVKGTDMKSYMRNWVTFPDSAETVLVGTTGYRFITITAPLDAPKGQYLFSVVACADVPKGTLPVSSTCTQTSSSLWGNSASLAITVK